ncbi:hypothetical protein ES703_57154 [subsurface metagenome]
MARVLAFVCNIGRGLSFSPDAGIESAVKIMPIRVIDAILTRCCFVIFLPPFGLVSI